MVNNFIWIFWKKIREYSTFLNVELNDVRFPNNFESLNSCVSAVVLVGLWIVPLIAVRQAITYFVCIASFSAPLSILVSTSSKLLSLSLLTSRFSFSIWVRKSWVSLRIRKLLISFIVRNVTVNLFFRKTQSSIINVVTGSRTTGNVKSCNTIMPCNRDKNPLTSLWEHLGSEAFFAHKHRYRSLHSPREQESAPLFGKFEFSSLNGKVSHE